MHYQHPQLEFKMDTCIVIELGRSGGLCVEIDEKTHSKNNKDITKTDKKYWNHVVITLLGLNQVIILIKNSLNILMMK